MRSLQEHIGDDVRGASRFHAAQGACSLEEF
jgi:hypothetical protein